MNNENLVSETEGDSFFKRHFNTVTTLSKNVALILFITLPFVGGWIGYKFSPEKLIVVEKIATEETFTSEKAMAPGDASDKQVAEPSKAKAITYFDICKEKAKKHSSFYFINDNECRLLYSNDFETWEEHDNLFEDYETIYQAEVGTKIDKSISNQIGTIKSFYRKDDRYFLDFLSRQWAGLYNQCEIKDNELINKDIFGNQATFVCDGEEYQMVSGFPTMTKEVSKEASINFLGSYASARHDLFSLSPEEYLMIWPEYEMSGQVNMRIYVEDNVIMDIEQMYTQ